MNKKRNGFTLIELLVVIGIIIVLAVVVVLAINPAQLLRQSRDSNRVAALSTVDTAIAYAQSKGFSLGTQNTIYISIPDPTLTGNATSDCEALGLPALTGYTYRCVSAANASKIDGTGWIPVVLNTTPVGNSLGVLPVDPTNSTSSCEYYVYITNGSGYELMAAPEAAKNASSTSFIQGSSLSFLNSFPSGCLGPVSFTTSTYSVGGLSGGNGSRIAFDSNNNALWMINNYGNLIKINDTTYATSTYGGAGLIGNPIIFDSNANTLWADGGYSSGTVTIINDTTLATSSVNTTGQFISPPSSLVFDPHTNTIWAGYTGGISITQINAATYATSSYTVVNPLGGGGTAALVFDPHTDSIWTANAINSGGTVSQINDTTYATSSFNGGSYLQFIAFDSHTNTIWVSNGGGLLTQINDTTYASSSINLGYLSFNAMVFDPHSNSILLGTNNQLIQINDTTFASTTYSVPSGVASIIPDPHTGAVWVTTQFNAQVIQFTPNH